MASSLYFAIMPNQTKSASVYFAHAAINIPGAAERFSCILQARHCHFGTTQSVYLCLFVFVSALIANFLVVSAYQKPIDASGEARHAWR